MTALVVAAVAILLVRVPSPVVARLRLVRPGPGRPRLPRRPPTGGPLVLAMAAAGAAGLAGWARLGYGNPVPVLPAVAGGVAGAAVAGALSRAAADRQRRRVAAALVESVGGLAAELRAGRPPADALAALVADPETAPVARHRAVAAVWAVSERSGAPAAAVLDRVEQDLRTRAAQQEELSAQLAGARSTAVLLAGLPLLGMSFGAGTGAQPLRVLLSEPPGQVALLIGIGLEAVGMLWTARIVAKAQGPR